MGIVGGEGDYVSVLVFVSPKGFGLLRILLSPYFTTVLYVSCSEARYFRLSCFVVLTDLKEHINRSYPEFHEA